MRIFQVLFKRVAQNPNKVPLKRPTRPFKLRSYVSGRTALSQDQNYTSNMLAVLTSFKTNDFDQNKCQKEIDTMHKAMATGYKQFLESKETRRSGKIQPYQKLSGIPLNKYLQRFPEPKKN